MTKRTRLRLRLALVGIFVVAVAVATLRRFGPGFLAGIVVGIFLGIALVAAAMLLMVRLTRRRVEEGLQPARVHRAQEWDYVMRLYALDERAINGASFRGRVLFLNFWGTWCAPCVAEMPSIERLASRVADADIAFACVTREPLEKVRSFIEKRGWRLPVYRIEGEPPSLFETLSIPATFIVAGDGTIAMRHIGAARWDSDEIVDFLRETAARARSPVTPESLPT